MYLTLYLLRFTALVHKTSSSHVISKPCVCVCRYVYSHQQINVYLKREFVCSSTRLCHSVIYAKLYSRDLIKSDSNLCVGLTNLTFLSWNYIGNTNWRWKLQLKLQIDFPSNARLKKNYCSCEKLKFSLSDILAVLEEIFAFCWLDGSLCGERLWLVFKYQQRPFYILHFNPILRKTKMSKQKNKLFACTKEIKLFLSLSYE